MRTSRLKTASQVKEVVVWRSRGSYANLGMHPQVG